MALTDLQREERKILGDTRRKVRALSKLLVECEDEAIVCRLAWEDAILDATEAGWNAVEIADVIREVVGDKLGSSEARLKQIRARARERRAGGEVVTRVRPR